MQPSFNLALGHNNQVKNPNVRFRDVADIILNDRAVIRTARGVQYLLPELKFFDSPDIGPAPLDQWVNKGACFTVSLPPDIYQYDDAQHSLFLTGHASQII